MCTGAQQVCKCRGAEVVNKKRLPRWCLRGGAVVEQEVQRWCRGAKFMHSGCRGGAEAVQQVPAVQVVHRCKKVQVESRGGGAEVQRCRGVGAEVHRS